MTNKQALVNRQQELQNQLDTMPIGKYTTTTAIQNRAISMLGKDKALKFLSSITSSVSTNPTLNECTNTSIFNGALLGESLNLSPSPQLGQYYLVPFKKKINGQQFIKVAQFQLGYKGYIQLAIRSGQYKKINVVEVREGEFLGYDPFNEEVKLQSIIDYKERKTKEVIGYYAMLEYLNGFQKRIYWSKEEMLDHADEYSQAFSKSIYEKILKNQIPEKDMWKYSSFWYKNFDEMAKKTMLRQLISKWGVMSVEMQRAFERDMSELKSDGTFEHIDNESIESFSVEDASIEEKEEELTPQEEGKIEESNYKQVDINEL